METHSSILAWRIPWTEEPGGLQSIGSQRVRQNRSDLFSMYTQKQLMFVCLSWAEVRGNSPYIRLPSLPTQTASSRVSKNTLNFNHSNPSSQDIKYIFIFYNNLIILPLCSASICTLDKLVWNYLAYD